MDHKLCERWILSENDLAPEDRRALADHLDDCERCRRLDRGWRTVRDRLRASPSTAPAPGFSARWADRLLLDDRRRRNRQSLGMLAATLVAAIFSFSNTGIHFFEGAGILAGAALERVQLFSGWFVSFGATISSAPNVPETLVALLIPPAVMVFFAAAGAGALAWLKMFRLLARLQGFTHWA